MSQWQVQNTVWGYTGTQTHGGVIDDNVAVDNDGNLILMANGDWYVGEKQGIVDTSDITVTGGQRTGAAICSTETYGPGSFEVVMKIPAFNGICTSIWLFNYVKSTVEGVDNDNYEIDIEVHGSTDGNDGNLSKPLFSTWLTERNHTSTYKDVGYNLADGKFHSFRIDWHTGENPYIEYYIDGVLILTYTEKVPTNEMYFNIGCWFPNNWCGQPNFETDFAVVKSFVYTPFEGETATKYNSVSKLSGGLVENVELPVRNLIANGNFDYALEQNNAWTVAENSTATVDAGELTLSGTVSQVVSMDCLGNSYAITVEGAGDVSVVITYRSIFDDVEVSGSVNGSLGTTRFTTPENCTQIVVEITSATTANITSVKLNVD